MTGLQSDRALHTAPVLHSVRGKQSPGIRCNCSLIPRAWQIIASFLDPTMEMELAIALHQRVLQ